MYSTKLTTRDECRENHALTLMSYLGWQICFGKHKMSSFSALMTEMNNLMCAWLDRDMFKYLVWCCMFTSWVFHTHTLFGSAEQEQCCAICCCEYVKDEIATLLPCHHMFHKLCVTLWLRKVMLFLSWSLWKRWQIKWFISAKTSHSVIIYSQFDSDLFDYLQNVIKETQYSLILFEHPLKVRATTTFMR